MNKELMLRWADSLEENKDIQSKLSYESTYKGIKNHCAIGVLVRKVLEDNRTMGGYSFFRSALEAGIKESILRQVIRMNFEQSFDSIAQFIREMAGRE